MTIQELARKARVTPRTIRYYVEQGVLPPPGRGRPSEYTGEHLQRLALVRRLKEQYLPLEEIRDTMQRLSLDEVEELLTRSAPAKEESSAETSASDYISNVLNQTAVREEMKRNSSYAPVGSPLPLAQAPMPVQTPAPVADLARQALGASNEMAETAAPSLARSILQEPRPAGMEQTGTWQRITVAPGVELHYLVSSDARINSIAAHLLRAAQDILTLMPGELSEENR